MSLLMIGKNTDERQVSVQAWGHGLRVGLSGWGIPAISNFRSTAQSEEGD